MDIADNKVYRSLCNLVLSIPSFSLIKTHKLFCNIHILPHSYYTFICIGIHHPIIGTNTLNIDIKLFKEIYIFWLSLTPVTRRRRYLPCVISFSESILDRYFKKTSD